MGDKAISVVKSVKKSVIIRAIFIKCGKLKR